MTDHRRTRPTPGGLAAPVLALAAVLALGLAAVALAPRASEAQRSSRLEGRGFLGVSLQDLDDDLRDSYDYRGDGVLVSDVTEDSPADKVGIEEGDILVKIGDRDIDDVREATDYVRSLSPGTRVAITVFRDGSTRSLGRATIADLQSSLDSDDRYTPRVPRAPRAPAAPRAPRAPRTPRVAPSPRVMTLPDGMQGLMMGSRGRLGVQTHDLDGDLGAYFDAPGGKGVLVLDVVDDTPASRAGLKAGDVILRVGDDDVADTEDLREALRQREAGRVELQILRSGSRRTVEAELGEAGAFDFQMGDGHDWMGWMHDGEKGDKDDKDGKQIRRHVFRIHSDGDDDDDNDFEWNDDSDLRNDMTPEERARFDERMEKLREDMRQLRREMQEMHDRHR